MAKARINIDNYESWFLDFVEGNLDEAGRVEVIKFAEEHPELATELDMDLSDLRLSPSQSKFAFAKTLKVPETGLNSLDELMISDIEGLLNHSQKAELQQIISEKNLQRDFALYRATLLKPASAEKFDLKSSVGCDVTFAINSGNEEEMLIACSEGILQPNEANFVRAYVDKHHLENKLASYVNAKLVADAAVVYSDKDSLKRRSGIVIPFYVRIAAAAAVIAALFFIPFYSSVSDVAKTVPDETPVSNVYYFARLNAKEINPANNNHVVEQLTIDPDNRNNFIEQNYVVVDEDQKLKQDTSRIKIEEILPTDFANDIIHLDSVPVEDLIEHIIPFDEVAEIIGSKSDSHRILTPRYRSDEPIGLLTTFANKKLGTDIAFTRKKDLKSDEYIAYHVKFGRFEFERKKSH